eukprot:TRINITY_DN4980_c0_g1_i4.p5 TRINITY_DN4980_c0_g1~~TRINITY_DN4980_c0_g1_i4.p5  ORF type:complete len:101 (-),score=32.11 TRINITY_DN4980_c0_g1_i4:24-326(-)
MHFLCVDNENKGKYQFRQNLRQLFEEFDKDNSGSLQMDELRDLLTANLRKYEEKAKAKGGETLEQFQEMVANLVEETMICLLYTSPSPRDRQKSRMPSSA